MSAQACSPDRQTDARHSHAPPAELAQQRPDQQHSQPWTLEPAAPGAATQQGLHNDEICSRRDLVRRRLARNRHHRAARSLNQSSIVSGLRLPAMRRHQRVPAKGLRSLHPKQSRTIHGPRNDAAAVAPFRNPLQRVAHRQRRHRSIGPTPNSSNHTLKQPRRSPRPGSVMTNHHINIIRNRLQPSPNRPRPSPPTSHNGVDPAKAVSKLRYQANRHDQRHPITSRSSRLNTPSNHRPPSDLRHHLRSAPSPSAKPSPGPSSQHKTPSPPHPPSLPRPRTPADERPEPKHTGRRGLGRGRGARAQL